MSLSKPLPSQARAAEIAAFEATSGGPRTTFIDPSGLSIERVKLELPCSTPDCDNTAVVERGILRHPGHVLNGRVVIPGLQLCDQCKQRRAERDEILERQRVEYVQASAQFGTSGIEKPSAAPTPYAPIPPEYRQASWAWTQEQHPQHAQLLADWHQDPHSVYLSGDAGRGKTMLLAAMAKRYIDTYPSNVVAWRNVSIMLDRIRRSINKPERTDNLIEDACAATLLVLDDLGAEAPSRWTLDRLYVVLQERIEQQRPTIITSNHSLRELRDHLLTSKDQDAGLGRAVDRLISRIAGTCRVLTPLTGPDHRIHKNASTGGAA